ncbi:MAG: hypothetical protein ACREQA_05215 [Candidatus Binatia bacterium]
MDLSNPKALAEHGEKIYQEKYKSAYESEHPGKFVAIDVTTEKTYIADSPKEALELARQDSPRGYFHLIKVGATGAFRVSYTNNATVDWIFR